MSESPAPAAQRDPFPKMIIVCCVIAAAFLIIIFTAVLFDFVSRGQEASAPPPFEMFDAPPGTIEGNPVRPRPASP